jgi:protocatechuate 3,4-dioxygenase beta subunit
MSLTRRAVFSALAASSAASLACMHNAMGEQLPGGLTLTPGCREGDGPTIAQIEGPYFTPDAPLKRDLAADVSTGEPVLIGGFVLDVRCRPVSRALVQLWQANQTGAYDNQGFKLRGHQFADDTGLWWFSTIVPGLYPGRTRHIHVKVQQAGGPVLTTQLYFPDEPRNRSDSLFDARLLMRYSNIDERRLGRFDFVI